MTESYLLLTPFLMLGVVAALGFVGCQFRHGESSSPAGPGPTNLSAIAGDGRIDLSWDAYTGATAFHLKRGFMSGTYTDTFDLDGQTTTYADTNVVNGTTYFYIVTASVATSSTETLGSNEVEATPQAAPVLSAYVTAKILGTPKNNITGYAGMAIQVASNPVRVYSLGRAYVTGNTATHIVKIVDAATNADVPGASVTITTVPAVDGEFQYADLPAPVTLSPNTSYYVVSQETSGGDHFYQADTTVQTTAVAVETAAVLSSGTSYGLSGTNGNTFGPLDFKYQV